MKRIGGYFGLTLPKVQAAFHEEATHLNTGRNALEYILRVKQPQKIILPYYLCEVLLEPVKKLDIAVEYYSIDENFFPNIDALDDESLLLYINYFGINDPTALALANKWGQQLVLDNTQSFFSAPPVCVGTFYSARKFFGVPDGAYLYTKSRLAVEFEQDVSFSRCTHLLKRLDTGAEEGYHDFVENDQSLSGQSIKQMSDLTSKLLSTIDYSEAQQIRKSNFDFLHSYFHKENQLTIDLMSVSGPLCYPLLVGNGKELKEKFIERKVFVPTYWNAVKDIVSEDSFERYLVDNLVCLPIDQRYDEVDMKYIIELFGSFEK